MQHIRKGNFAEGVHIGPVQAEKAARFVGGDIIGAKDLRKPWTKTDCISDPGVKRTPQRVYFSAMFCQFFRGKIQRLVPGDAAPFAFTALAFSKQGVFQPVRIIELLNARIAAGAQHCLSI